MLEYVFSIFIRKYKSTSNSKVTMTQSDETKQWSEREYTKAEEALEIIQYKYVGNILTYLSHNKRLAFWELKRILDPISTKVLSERLKLLVSEEYIWNEKVMEWNIEKSYYFIKKDPQDLDAALEAFKDFAV